MNPKPYVFISYSSKNKLIVADLEKILIANGINYWMAPQSIPPASDYASEIPAAIEKSHAVLLVLTKESQESEWVPKELDKAITKGKPIIPFHIDQSSLTAAFDFRLSNVQRIDAFGRISEAYDELLEQLCALLGIQRVRGGCRKEEAPEKETVVKNFASVPKTGVLSDALLGPIPCKLAEGNVKNTGHLKCYPDRIVFSPVAGKEKTILIDNVTACRWSPSMLGKQFGYILSLILGFASVVGFIVGLIVDVTGIMAVFCYLLGVIFFTLVAYLRPYITLTVKKDHEQSIVDKMKRSRIMIKMTPSKESKELVYYLKNHLNCKMPGI